MLAHCEFRVRHSGEHCVSIVLAHTFTGLQAVNGQFYLNESLKQLCRPVLISNSIFIFFLYQFFYFFFLKMKYLFNISAHNDSAAIKTTITALYLIQ